MKNIKVLNSNDNIAGFNQALVRAWVVQNRGIPVKYDGLVDVEKLNKSAIADEVFSVLDGTHKDCPCGHIHGWSPELAGSIALLEIKLV